MNPNRFLVGIFLVLFTHPQMGLCGVENLAEDPSAGVTNRALKNLKRDLPPPPPMPPVPAAPTEGRKIPRGGSKVLQVPLPGPLFSATLSWDTGNTNAPPPAGYKIYFSNQLNMQPGVPPAIPINVGNVLTYKIQGLNATNPYFFLTTAYDTNGVESTPSTQIAYMIPRILSYKVQTTQTTNGVQKAFLFQALEAINLTDLSYSIKYSYNLKSWTNETPQLLSVTNNSNGTQTASYSVPIDPTHPVKFFRVNMNLLFQAPVTNIAPAIQLEDETQ